MEKYRIEVSGTAVAKQRPRGFKDGKGNIRFYTPKKSKDFEYLIRKRAEEIFKEPLTCPLKVSLVFLMPRPKRLCWKTRPMPEVPCPMRPDLDNMLKSVNDGLNGVAFLDDAQITDCHILKRYHSGDGGSPKTIIDIEADDTDDK
jgi:Holliday junction resolvase RusA-like endonuclease